MCNGMQSWCTPVGGCSKARQGCRPIARPDYCRVALQMQTIAAVSSDADCAPGAIRVMPASHEHGAAVCCCERSAAAGGLDATMP